MVAKYRYKQFINGEFITLHSLVEIVRNDAKTYVVRCLDYCRKNLNHKKRIIMETKHTNGKWTVVDSGGKVISQTSANSYADICILADRPLAISPEVEANAKLIAAAPEMLIALQKAVEVIERMSDEFSAIANRHASYTVGESRIIEGAIKKATE